MAVKTMRQILPVHAVIMWFDPIEHSPREVVILRDKLKALCEENPARVLQQNAAGDTPIHLAVARRAWGLIAALLSIKDSEEQLSVENNKGVTAYECLVRDLVRFRKERGRPEFRDGRISLSVIERDYQIAIGLFQAKLGFFACHCHGMGRIVV